MTLSIYRIKKFLLLIKIIPVNKLKKEKRKKYKRGKEFMKYIGSCLDNCQIVAEIEN